MLQRILVPTDGSPESEKAIPIAAQIARAQGAELVVIRAIEPPPWLAAAGPEPAATDVFEEMIETIQQEAEESLARIEADLQAQGLRAKAVAIHGSPSAALLDYEVAHQTDLLVMATHGRTGLARFTLGSVTDHMVREGQAPVLVVRRSSPAATTLHRALVTLDGSGLAEEALPMLEALAGKPLESVVLFRVEADPRDQGPAMTYLQGVAGRMSSLPVKIEAVVDVGPPTPGIERVALTVDLIIICTHGRGGLDRLRHGSVAEHVVREIETPALLVRAGTQGRAPTAPGRLP